jgi:hypothetical protein
MVLALELFSIWPRLLLLHAESGPYLGATVLHLLAVNRREQAGREERGACGEERGACGEWRVARSEERGACGEWRVARSEERGAGSK